MEKKYLQLLSEKLKKLNELEQKQRDKYLRCLSNGELYGPGLNYPDIDKPWLKFYPESAIDSTIPKMKAYNYIFENNKNNMSDIALYYLGNEITFREFFENVDETTKAFRKIGIKRGDVVTIAMATTPETVYILYALNRIGACVNAIHPKLKIDDMKEKINSTKSKVFIGLDFVTEELVKNKEGIENIEIISASPLLSAKPILRTIGKIKSKKIKNIKKWEDFISEGMAYNGEMDSDYYENEPVIILYTGGTTGEPKGVVLTNENLNTMAMTQIVSEFNVERQDTFLNFLPPFSAYSIVNAIHDPLVLGFKTILVPKFTEHDFPNLMAKYKPNHVLSGPILWDIMIKSKKCKNLDLSFLKSPISGGDSLSLEKEKEINEYLSRRGCKYKIQQGYGMTEVSAAACYSSEKSYNPGSVGIPYVKNNIVITNMETNEKLQFNEIGKIGISTPTMMNGYNNNDEATNEIISIGDEGKRVIDTGDIGYVDNDGRVYVIGRSKRLIVRSGEKIFPSNIENLILTLDEVAMCSIVGIPDKKEKSVPIAHIVLKEEYSDIPKEEIIDKINGLILAKYPSFMLPKKIVFRNELPLTEMTKIDFKQLEHESAEMINDNDAFLDLTNLEKNMKKTLQ